MEFIGGLILGAVLGVVADRLWKRIEQKPRFKVVGSHTFGIAGDGLQFKVTNVGVAEIPPHKLNLFHKNRGTISFFTSNSAGRPLLAGQSHEHAWTLIKHQQPCTKWGEEGDADQFLTRWIHREFDYDKQEESIVDEPRYEGFLFRIVMENSDHVLFESETIGNAVAKEIASADKHKKVGVVGGYEHSMQLQYHPTSRFLTFFRRFKLFNRQIAVR